MLDSLFPRGVPPKLFMLTLVLSMEDGRVVSCDGLSTFVLIIEEARVVSPDAPLSSLPLIFLTSNGLLSVSVFSFQNLVLPLKVALL